MSINSVKGFIDISGLDQSVIEFSKTVDEFAQSVNELSDSTQELSKTLEKTKNPQEVKLLQKFRETCLKNSFTQNDEKLSKSLAYIQAIQLSKQILGVNQ